ncbi:putative bifunctional diguanylate cyclase/phosphodiesterase [Actinoplanes rectilineatus]|uniref:putative bifunctional diguanylate cyclase/phosphodiesterase n=1 Tax=Actinoplanes rectilineatus TaxID=113571 RepID=UPI0005F2EEDE|nr:EAL domain-containing protein [Actinoplanes rectilineatus]
MSTRVVRACFGAWLVLAIGVYYAFPQSHLYSWAALGFSSALMVLAGVRIHRPQRPLPWYLIAAALACLTTGDTVYNAIVAAGQRPPSPSGADLFYLATYPLLTVGFLIFVRARDGGTRADRAALLDALVPTVGLGLLVWVYWIAPFTRDTDLTFLQKVVAIGYPLGDGLALAVLLRLLASSARRPGAATTLGVAMVGLLCADLIFGQSQLSDDWNVGGPVDLGWVVFYGATAFAALRPSMRDLTEPGERTTSEMSTHRLLFLATAALVAPVVLFVEYLQNRAAEIAHGGLVDAPVIAAAAAVMFLLVLARVGDLAMAQRQAGARERALRQAGTTMFSAATVEDVAKACRRAVALLMPADRDYFLQLPAPFAGEAPEGVRLIPAAELPAGRSSGGYRTVLYATQALPGGMVGSLVLGAPEPVLRAVHSSFATLSTQIAVIMERITLTAEVSRRDSEAYFRTLIQSASDVIMIVSDDGVVTYASPSAGELFGTSDPTGETLAGLLAGDSREAMNEVLDRLDGGLGELDRVALAAVTTDGRRVEIECDVRDLRADPTVRGLVLTMRDVTERRRLEEDLTHQAFHDSLTGLANRVLFRNRLEQLFSVAARDGSIIGLLFVDLDDFKEVNDALGHAVGDQLLIEVAGRISEIVGAGSTAARMGGDEFAVLIEPSEGAERAEQVAARLVSTLSQPIEVIDTEGMTRLVSGAASVGLATNREAENPTELLRHADLALYLAKGLGKGAWQRYQSDLHTAMVQRLETRTQLLEAIEEEQFVLQYQPIVELSTGLISGLEALVRWQHPMRGLLGPYHFVEAAEESGAIVGIGEWVLRAALEQFSRWRMDDPECTLRYVSVNVSPRQFRSGDFADQVRRAIAESGARPEWLLLEITESLVLGDTDKVLSDLKGLRALGVRVAIDDFGTGYSSLSYLRQMPVDVLKLDKSFIDDVLHSRQQHALVDAIVTLARNLDLAVVAEGIEETGQHTALDAMGCQYGQGYLFAKPLWPGEIPALTTGAAALAAPPRHG